MNIVNDIKEFLINKKLIKSADELSEKDSLLEKGIIDSVIMIELVSFIENKYSIKIDEDELMPENFDSLTAIKQFVIGKIE